MNIAVVKYNHLLPRLISKFMPISAITIGKYILVTGKNLPSRVWIHEFHHINQIQEYGFFSFYLSYFLFYLAGLVKFRSHMAAYLNIPYEIDARRVEAGLTPLDPRLLKYSNETFSPVAGGGTISRGNSSTDS